MNTALKRSHYTVGIADGIDFDAHERSPFRALYSPAMVTADDWSVGYRHELGTDIWCLNARHITSGERHALNGTEYRSQDEAARAAYGAGLLRWMLWSTDNA